MSTDPMRRLVGRMRSAGWFVSVVVLLLALSASALTVIILDGLAQTYRRPSFPVTEAVVTRTYTTPIRSQAMGTIATIVFEYEYRGRTYESKDDRSWSGVLGIGAEENARRCLAEYPAGKRITVHYDPDAPEDAFIDPPGLTAWTVLEWAFGLFIIWSIAYEGSRRLLS